MRSASSGKLAPLIEYSERSCRRGHQEAVAARYQAFDVFSVGVRMAAGNFVFFTDSENGVDRIGNNRMIVIPGMTQFLAQISFANQHHADSRNLLENLWQIVDRARFFALNDNQNFPARCQGPNIGAAVVFLLRQSPIACRARWSVATNARRIMERGFFKSWVAAGAHGIPRLLDRAHMRKND